MFLSIIFFYIIFSNGFVTQYVAVGRGRYYTRKGGVFSFFPFTNGCETQYFAVGRGRYYTRKGGVFFFLSLMVARHSTLRLAGAGTIPERVESFLFFLFPNGCETQYFAVGRGRYYTRKGGVFSFFPFP